MAGFRGFCIVAHAATWPSLPLRSATASEQQSTSAPGRRLTWPPVRERGSVVRSRLQVLPAIASGRKHKL
jgi:hypothetical protein